MTLLYSQDSMSALFSYPEQLDLGSTCNQELSQAHNLRLCEGELIVAGPIFLMY